MRIFDIHTHPIHRQSGCNRKGIRKLIRDNRALGITGMNILGDVAFNGPRQNAAQVTEINEESASLQAEHPDFFTFFCYLNPTLGETAVMREVERCVTKHGARGIKLEAANHAADLCMRHVAKAARTFDIVVLQHSWSIDTNNHLKNAKIQTDPEHTALFARRNPDVKVIMAHLNGCGHRGVIAVKDLPNVWVDISGAYPVDGILEYAVEQLGADRVLYGSDIPIRENRVKIGLVQSARLNTTAKQKIFYENAAQLIHLS